MTLPPEERNSTLMLDEFFNAEDDRFTDELRKINSPSKLAGFADRWKKDPRPWARKQIFNYLDLPLDRPGHQPLVKRLFKHAHAQNDAELMAAFMAAFDRLVRRTRKTLWRYDLETRSSTEEEKLVTPRNALKGRGENERKKQVWLGGIYRRSGMLFTYHTRYYLRRRAWRFFRTLARTKSAAYPQAVARALALYYDADLAKGENILDSWSLLHACFHDHDALEFGASSVLVKDGRGLGELTAAPYCLKAWQAPESAKVLTELLLSCRARLVRVFCIQLLRAHHKDHLGSLDANRIFQLLEHDDEDIQQFGAELLQSAKGLERLPISAWLRFLLTKNLTALQTVCDCFVKHVSAERLELGPCIELACNKATAVSRLGLGYLKSKAIQTPEDRAAIAALANSRCDATGREVTEWALRLIGPRDVYDRELVCRFFDSLNESVRDAAWDWLLKDSAGYHDPGLFARLIETPFDRLRLSLIDLMHKRSIGALETPGLRATGLEALAPVWCSVLLSVHRGGRQKGKAVRQIGEAIREKPQAAELLLPILAVAIRSVRPSEARAGLSAVVGAVECHPELAAAVEKHLPELKLSVAEAAQ